MFPTIFKTKIGNLSLEGGADLIFYGENDLPNHQTILDFIKDVGASTKKWKLPINYVVREFNHLEGWIEAFLRVEKRDLDQRFRKMGKGYEAWVLGDRLLSEIDIIVRLKTVGLDGYTEYRISIVKVSDDEFLCVE